MSANKRLGQVGGPTGKQLQCMAGGSKWLEREAAWGEKRKTCQLAVGEQGEQMRSALISIKPSKIYA